MLLSYAGEGDRDANLELRRCTSVNNGLFVKNGSFILLFVEPLDGFNPPIAPTKDPVERKNLYSIRDCESILSYFFQNENQ